MTTQQAEQVAFYVHTNGSQAMKKMRAPRAEPITSCARKITTCNIGEYINKELKRTPLFLMTQTRKSNSAQSEVVN